jgi:hypothetical protein
MRTVPLLMALIAPLIGLGGCVATDPADPALVLQEALATHQANLAGVAPRTPASGGEGQAVPGTPAPATLSAASPDAGGEAPPAMAGQLVGHPPETVTRWLGEPRLRREEDGAEIWHYQASQCHLDIVLYREDGPGPAWRVAFAQARATGTARRGEAACLRDIARGAVLRPAPVQLSGLAEAG